MQRLHYGKSDKLLEIENQLEDVDDDFKLSDGMNIIVVYTESIVVSSVYMIGMATGV